MTTTDETFDPGIAEIEIEQRIERTFDELEFRSVAAGTAYPFQVARNGPTIHFNSDSMTLGHQVYLFCLLASALRSGRLSGQAVADAATAIAEVFQLCACIAAAGFTSGAVASFGFPRATHDAFLPALQNTYLRFGCGTPVSQIPAGYPRDLKDGGIDVIAWRNFPDALPGKLYLVGQAASGVNWKEKSVVGFISQLHGSWFVQQPAAHAIPAMFIPFPQHEELDEQLQDFPNAQKNLFRYNEAKFGLIFDRNRLSSSAALFSGLPDSVKELVDGADRLDEMAIWVQQATELLQSALR